jgi:hypothetical protein
MSSSPKCRFLLLFSVFSSLLAAFIFDWHLRSDRWILKLPTIDWRISGSWTGTLRLAHCQYSPPSPHDELRYMLRHNTRSDERALCDTPCRIGLEGFCVWDLVLCWTSFFYEKKKWNIVFLFLSLCLLKNSLIRMRWIVCFLSRKIIKKKKISPLPPLIGVIGRWCVDDSPGSLRRSRHIHIREKPGGYDDDDDDYSLSQHRWSWSSIVATVNNTRAGRVPRTREMCAKFNFWT